MSAGFTPGPWLVHATNRLVCQAEDAFKTVRVENGVARGDDPPNSICLLRDPGDDLSEDETLANGFLIAAAPELFEALEGISWKSADRDNMEFAATVTYSRMDKIRAALAKARAEQVHSDPLPKQVGR